VNEFWHAMENLRSDIVFELVDHFRIAHNCARMHNKNPDACELILRLHQLLADKMVESNHRNYLFRRALSF
jgi:hypothetical protein